MLPRAGRFFLAFYAICGLHQAVRADDQCAIDPKTIVSDACTTYSELDTLNSKVALPLYDLTHTDFFAYYRLNLYNKACPFWNDENSMCGNRACAVDTIDDEKDVPSIWRVEELSKLEGLRAQHPGPQVRKERPNKRPLQFQLGEDVNEGCVFEADDECDERDYCVPEDEGATSKGDYVSLLNNTERFTGYTGDGAWQVWDAIYKENCFSREGAASGLLHDSWKASAHLREIFQEYGRQKVDSSRDALAIDDQCIEQRAFYRIISGMHASISTHICWDYFNQTTGEWVRNLDCYKERLHQHPDRISNLYFNYAIVTRALGKLKQHLQSYTFCTGDPEQDLETKQRVLSLTKQITSAPLTFDESIMFQDAAMIELKDDFKQRFRNVSRLMDCVGCDKCRLWGKLQTAGYGAALKVLFEFDETKNGENPNLRRTELVALVNTYARLSHSMEAIRKFRAAAKADSVSWLNLARDPTASLRPVGKEPPSVAAAVTDTSQSHAASVTTSKAGSEGKHPPSPPDRPAKKQHRDNDFEGLDDDPYAHPPGTQRTLWEEIKDETDLVWRAYKMVLRSWINLPFKLGAIFVMEMNRLWSYYLGLPVPPRSWNLHFPTRDEL